MTRSQVKAKIDDIIIDQLGLPPDEPPADELRFVEHLKADSLDSVEMVMKIEDEFDLKIPDDEVAKLKTVGDMVNYVFKTFVEKRK